MENPEAGDWIWKGILLYVKTYSRLPPVIIDINLNLKTKEVTLKTSKTSCILVPWYLLIGCAQLFFYIGISYILLKRFCLGE